MPLSTASNPPKHWDLSMRKIMRLRSSSGNSSEGDNHFSLKRIVGKARRSGTLSTGYGEDPPPPPPKDTPKRSSPPLSYSAGSLHQPKRSTSTGGSNGSQRNIGNGYQKFPVDITLAEVHMSSPASKPVLNFQSTTSLHAAPPPPALPSKFNSRFKPLPRSGPPTKLPTPAERAKARIEAEREKEKEISLVIQQEEERQARLKAEKEEQRRREEEEEARRREKIEQDIRFAQILKKRREQKQADEDEKFLRRVEERRRVNKAKRIQVHYKSQALRNEQEVSKKETPQEMKEERRKEIMQECKKLFDTMSAECSGRLKLDGWISVQSAGTVTWRRRWFVLDKEGLRFFKAQEDASPVDIITVSDIHDVRNGGGPSEEEPSFMPNSFVIEELKERKLSWSLYTDTPDTMERVMAALIFSSNVHKTKDL